MSINLTLVEPDISEFENGVDPNQLASNKAIWSGSTLFIPLIENTYLWIECCRLIG